MEREGGKSIAVYVQTAANKRQVKEPWLKVKEVELRGRKEKGNLNNIFSLFASQFPILCHD